MSYTLDQQLTDIETAINIAERSEKIGTWLFLCLTAKRISHDFEAFLKRRLVDMENVSPEMYKKSMQYLDKEGGTKYIDVALSDGEPLWDREDYDSRKQFLNDLKNWLIENG